MYTPLNKIDESTKYHQVCTVIKISGNKGLTYEEIKLEFISAYKELENIHSSKTKEMNAETKEMNAVEIHGQQKTIYLFKSIVNNLDNILTDLIFDGFIRLEYPSKIISIKNLILFFFCNVFVLLLPFLNISQIKTKSSL